MSKNEISSERAGSLPHFLHPSRVDEGMEKRRYDIAARKGATRCRKILKLKILNGDIRVRDIGGRQLSCSWRLLRRRERGKTKR